MAAVVSLAAYALSVPGYATHHAELNDGGIWVTKSASGQFARLNKPIDQLDGAIYSVGTQQSSYNLDVQQDGAAVVGVDLGGGQIYPLDAQRMRVAANSAVKLPAQPVIGMDGGTLAVLDGAKGEVRAMTYDPGRVIAGVAPLDSAAPALAKVGSDAALAVGRDGTVFAASADKGLATITRTASGFAKPRLRSLDPVRGTLSITVVGVQPVVLVATATGGDVLILPSGKRVNLAGGASATLQQPGPDTPDVLVATDSSLFAVPLDGGKPRELGSDGTGEAPAAPVQLRGCIFAAWAGTPGTFAKECGGGVLKTQAIPGASTPGRLVFRVNHQQLLLNDRETGNTWNVDSGKPVQVANWQEITKPSEQGDKSKNQDHSTDASRPQPPKPRDDELGARPGRTSALYVLDNDSDPSGEVLAVDSVKASSPQQQDWLSVAPDGQTVDIALPAGTTADTTFTYQVRSAKGGTASAAVVVHARADGVNSPPTRRLNATDRTWVVPSSGTVTVPVLADWRDYADGDPVVLREASAAAGSVATTPDGLLIYTAPVTPGPQTIDYTVSDGHGGDVKSTLHVQVQGTGDKPVAATAQPDFARGQVDQPIIVHPLANDLPGSDPLEPTATMRLVGGIAGPAGTTVTVDAASGTVTVVAKHPGTFALGYQVAYGNAPYGTGEIRIDVDARTQPRPPVTAPDFAVVRGQAPVTVDVLSNDADPAGNVLAVLKAQPTDPAQLQVAIVDGRFLRVAALSPQLSPSTQSITYWVSNGVTGPATGQLNITQLPSPAKDIPITLADYATVRGGDSVTIPVLDNDATPAGDPLTLVRDVQGAPASGQLTVTPNLGSAYVSGRMVRYVAPTSVTAPTQVTIDYVAQNGDGDTAGGRAIVTITPPVSAANPDQPPQPRPVEARVVAGDTVTVKIPTSGIDPDGDSVIVTGIASAPTLGRVVAVSATSIKYEAYPQAGNGGTDSFGYVVADTHGKTATSTVRIAVVPPGDPQPPVAVDDTVTVAPGASVRVDVLANDLIAPDDHVTIGRLSDTNPDLPAGVKLESPQGPITVRAGDEKHPVVVLYRVSNGIDTSTATLTVRSQKGVNLPPAVFDQFATVRPGTDHVTVDLLSHAYDPDGSGALRVVAPATGVTGGKLTVTLAPTPQVIPFVVEDGGGARATASAYVPPSGGGAPYVKPDSLIRVPADGATTIDIADYVLDPAGKKLRITTRDTVSASPSGKLTPERGADAAHLVLTAAKGYVGPAALTFQVTDGASLNQAGAQVAYVTIPAQVGDATPVLRCPSTVFDVVEGGKAVPIDVARVCHVWTAQEGGADALRFTGRWDSKPDRVDVSGNGSRTISIKARGGARPGTTGTLRITVDGFAAATPQTLQFQVVKAPKPVVTPVSLDGVKAGETKTVDVTPWVKTAIGDPAISVVGRPVKTGGMDASISASGAKLSVTPGKDSHGKITFTFVVTDVDDTSRTDRQVTGQLTVNALGHPDAPTNVAPGRTVRSHVVDLSWTAPAANGAPIDHYVVDYGSGKQSCPTSPCTITDLKNGTSYRFTVTAYNAVGASPPSRPSAPAMPDKVPPAVADFAAANPQDHQLTLSWTPVKPDGTAVERYQISWPGGTGPVDVAAGATSYVASGLDNSQITTFTIIAINKQGPGDKATTTGQSAGKPATPPAPTVSVTDDMATNKRVVKLTWDAIDPNGPGPTRYTVTRTANGSESTLTCADDTATTCTDPGVTLDGTVYTYALTARNAPAEKDPAPHTSARGPAATMEAAATPDPITNIATHVGNGTADGQAPVTFNLGASHGKTSDVSCSYNGGTCFSQTGYPTGGQANVSATLHFPYGYSGTFTLTVCNGSSGNSSNFSGARCRSSNPVSVSVNAPPSQPGGGSCGLSGNTVTFYWGASNTYGARSLAHYSLSGAIGGTTTSTNASVSEPADGGSSTLTVVAVDSNGEESSARNITCPHAQPPPPTSWKVKTTTATCPEDTFKSGTSHFKAGPPASCSAPYGFIAKDTQLTVTCKKNPGSSWGYSYWYRISGGNYDGWYVADATTSTGSDNPPLGMPTC